MDNAVLPASRHRALVISALIAFGLHLMLAFPGIMTWDSKEQYAQAIAGRYDDWHPPIMAFVWRSMLPLAQGGGAMLAFHLAMIWGALLIVARALDAAGHRKLPFAILASGLLPTNILLSAYIHKDVGLAGALLLAFAIMFRARLRGERPTPGAALAVAVLVFYALLVRANAAFAVGPVLVYALAPARLVSPVRLVASTAVVFVLAFLLGAGMNRLVFHALALKPARSLIVFDVTGIAYRSRDTTVFPHANPPTLGLIDHCYTSELWDPLNHTICRPLISRHGLDRSDWLHAVARHPIAYAQHRIAHLDHELFGFVRPLHWDWKENPRFPDLPRNRFEDANKAALDGVSNFPLFSPLVFLALAAGIVAMLVPGRRYMRTETDLAAWILSWSALIYAGGFAVVGVASMYRYQQIDMMAAVLAVILYAAGRRHRPPAENRMATFTIGGLGTVAVIVAALGRMLA